jgi:hypothetical protein
MKRPTIQRTSLSLTPVSRSSEFRKIARRKNRKLMYALKLPCS